MSQSQAELASARMMIQDGADMDGRPWKIPTIPEQWGSRGVTPLDVLFKVFSAQDAKVLVQLSRKIAQGLCEKAGVICAGPSDYGSIVILQWHVGLYLQRPLFSSTSYLVLSFRWY